MRNYFPKVSLLILNWKGIDFTRTCIKSLLECTYPNIEIILVDNGSGAEEQQQLKNEFGKLVTLVMLPTNVGYAAGMNTAFVRATGKYIMLLNNDMEFPKKWLTPLVVILEKNSKIGACQPRIRDIKHKTDFEYASAAGGFVDMFGYPFARGRIFTDIEKDKGQYEQPIRVAWAGIMLIRKNLIEKIGLFDPIFFNYGEDMDLSVRIYNAGFTIVNIPESIVYHVGGGTLKRNLRKKMFFHHRNNMIFLIKNWPNPLISFVLIPRIILDFISLLYYILNGFTDGAIAVCWAYWSLLTMVHKILIQRKKFQRTYKKENFERIPIYKGSIVWDYYISKKRKFSDVITDSNFHSIDIRI